MVQIASIEDYGMPIHYHQKFDTIDRIHWDQVKLTRSYLYDLISAFDKKFN